MGKSLIDIVKLGALGATGFGLAGIGPLAALGEAGAVGAGAAEAGATGASLAGADAAALGAGGVDAMTAQGATGLLGASGAEAAGYGSAASNAALAGNAAASTLPEYAAYGPNNEFWGQTIANDGMTANAYTGGYDSMGTMGRLGQQVSGFVGDTNNMGIAKQGMGLLNGQQQPQQPQNINKQTNVMPRQQAPSSPSSFVQGNNQSNFAPNFGVQEALARKEELQRQMAQAQYNNYPHFGGR
jgi:hypothetical protein